MRTYAARKKHTTYIIICVSVIDDIHVEKWKASFAQTFPDEGTKPRPITFLQISILNEPSMN